MNLEELLLQIKKHPESVQFSDCIELINKYYHFSPTSFVNGNQQNDAGQNNGSCKIFAFGLIHKLTEQQVLNCFGEYYRKDVLKNPESNDHLNIRQFMSTGWQGIQFSGSPLKLK